MCGTEGCIPSITRATPRMDTTPGTTRGPAATGVVQSPMVPTVEPGLVRATTDKRERTPEQRRPMALTALAVWPRHTIRAPAHMHRRDRAPTFMGAGERRVSPEETRGQRR